jgi:hypothetical protein
MRSKKILQFLIVSVLFLCTMTPCVCQEKVFSQHEAEAFLKQVGFREFIQDVETLRITPNQIRGEGGASYNRAISASVRIEDLVIFDDSARGSVHLDGTILVTANIKLITGAYGSIKGNPFLLVGRDIKHIAASVYNRMKD